MVPAYRPNEKCFRQSLESVLEQAPGEGQMQIEVVDDCSPDVDVAAMTRLIGGERVSFSSTSKNLGLAGCWNACIEHSRGQWVHILHQDDYVLPGFYARLARAAQQHPEVNLLATRSFYVDPDGVIIEASVRLRRLENGGRFVDDFFYATPIQCPGIAIKRSFYEAHGGFRADLAFTLDCEMWTRVISAGGGLVTPEVLSCYRMSDTNETGRLSRTAEDARDLTRLNDLFAAQHSTFDSKAARERACYMAIRNANRLSAMGDAEGAKANRDFWRNNAPPLLRLRLLAVTVARKIFG